MEVEKCEHCGIYPAVVKNAQNLNVCSRCDGSVTETFKHSEPRTRRNDMCVCGSGKKFKNCCMRSK